MKQSVDMVSAQDLARLPRRKGLAEVSLRTLAAIQRNVAFFMPLLMVMCVVIDAWVVNYVLATAVIVLSFLAVIVWIFRRYRERS